MIRAAIFDLGGVLVPEITVYICEKIKQKLHLDNATFETAWNRLLPLLRTGKISELEFGEKFREITHAVNILPEDSFFLSEFKARFAVNSDVLKIIITLKQRNFSIAALSDTIKLHADFLREQGMLSVFDVLIFSNEVGITKPNEEIYFMALRKLNVRADETFYVDDRQENVEAANALGIHSIMFQNVNHLKDELKNLGIIV